MDVLSKLPIFTLLCQNLLGFLWILIINFLESMLGLVLSWKKDAMVVNTQFSRTLGLTML